MPRASRWLPRISVPGNRVVKLLRNGRRAAYLMLLSRLAYVSVNMFAYTVVTLMFLWRDVIS